MPESSRVREGWCTDAVPDNHRGHPSANRPPLATCTVELGPVQVVPVHGGRVLFVRRHGWRSLRVVDFAGDHVTTELDLAGEEVIAGELRRGEGRLC